MTSISDDQTLPLDLDGTSNVLSMSTHNGTTSVTTLSDTSELEQPGTFANLTSAGKMSPHRTRTMKDQEIQLGEMKKENFGLKLRIYHLEEALRSKHGDTDKGWKMNIELQVQLENFKKELAEKDRLLMQAKSALDHMKAAAPKGPSQQDLDDLEEMLAEREADLREKKDELEEARKEAEDANNRADEVDAINNQLEDELQDNDKHIKHLNQELSELQQALAERKAPKATPTLCSSAAQTVDPFTDELAESAAELDAARAELVKKERKLGEMKDAMDDKERKVKEMELKILSMTQEMATIAGDHAQEMRAKESELEEQKAKLREAKEKYRRKEAECEDCARERDAEAQRARELEAQVRRLRPLIQDREREIQDLRDRLSEAERLLESGDHDKDKELSNLRKKLSEARAKAKEAEPELAANQREIKRLLEALDDKEDELRRLKAKVRELEEELSQSKMSMHTANIEKNEQAEALNRLQMELEALRKQLMRQHDGIQHDLEGSLAAKDAIIEQLRREVDDLRAKLSEAERKNTASAAQIGILNATIEDLVRQLEQLQKQLKDQENKTGMLLGEKAGLEREVGRLSRENEALREQVAALEEQLADYSAGLEQAEEAIAELRKLLEQLQAQHPKVNTAELAALRGEIAALELALKGKKAELASLMQTLGLKDRTIRELQQELQRVRGERGDEEERVRELEEENARLEKELSDLRSQDRIHQLSMSNLQDRLTQAFAEREEMARKLKQAEDALRDKDVAYRDMEDMYKHLSQDLHHLHQQLRDLKETSPRVTVTHHHHETTTTHPPPPPPPPPSPPPPSPPPKEKKDSSRNTTMIFGNLSENLFLTILQRLQELYNEIAAGRADSHTATSSLSARLEHLAALQKHLEESLKARGEGVDGGDSPGKQGGSTNTSYTTYYYTDREGGMEDKDGAGPGTSDSPRRQAGARPDSEAAINALRAEMEEMRRWNEALQARLDKTRDVGVGMEKGGASSAKPQGSNVSQEKYVELTREVDRLLEELERERERSRAEHLQQQEEMDAIRETLQNTERKLREMESKLRTALLKEEGASADHEKMVGELEDARATIARLRGQLEGAMQNASELRGQADNSRGTIAELRGQIDNFRRTVAELRGQLANSQSNNAELRGKLENNRVTISELMGKLDASRKTIAELRGQLDNSRSTIAQLRGQLDFETKENLRLREEIADISINSTSLGRSPRKEEQDLNSSSSMPNLLASGDQEGAGLRNNTSDSWTSPRTPLAERPDVRALKAKNEDITRLNYELQRKCHEQLLKTTPSQSRPGSGGGGQGTTTTTLLMRTRLREQEDSLRSEMAERERDLLSQVRNAESMLLEKEAEWQAKGARFRREKVELETQLAEAMKSKQELRSKVLESEVTVQGKDEEIVNLKRALARSQDKTRALEERIDVLLAEKNTIIHDLEQRIHHLEEELELSRESAVRLRHSLRVVGGAKGRGGEGGGGGGVEREVQSLHETLDELSQQLASSLEESHDLLERHEVLDGHKTLLSDQLASYQDQVKTLRSELAIYQKLVEEMKKDTPTSEGRAEGGDREGMHERVLKLLADVADLRDQLDGSIRNHSDLSERLRTRLSHASFEMSATGEGMSSHADKASGTKGSRTREKGSGSGYLHASTYVHHNTSPHTSPKASSSPKSSPQSRHRQRDSTEFKGLNLTSSSSSSFLSSSSSRLLEGEGPDDGGRGHRTQFSSVFNGFGGDFDTLETRLQKALDSPSLQGQDRTFLEELLIYLRRQRQQLDDSKRLLEKLEKEQQDMFNRDGISPASHITPQHHSRESGTIHISHSSSSSLGGTATHTAHSATSPPLTRHSFNSGSQTRSHAGTDYGSQTRSHAATDYGSQTKPHAGTESGSQTRSHADTDYGSQTKSHAATNYGSQTKPHAGTESGSQTRSHAGTDYGSQTKPHAGTDSGTRHASTNGGVQTQSPGASPPFRNKTYSSSYGTQTQSPGASPVFRSKTYSGTQTRSSGASPVFGSKTYTPSYGTQTNSPAFTSYGIQTTGRVSPGVSNSPRGVARVVVSRSTGPSVNGFEGRGVGGRTSSGKPKVELSSLYEQLLQTHTSLVEAKNALTHQQTQ